MRPIDVLNAAQVMNEKFGIPYDELVDAFAEIPTFEMVKAKSTNGATPKNTVRYATIANEIKSFVESGKMAKMVWMDKNITLSRNRELYWHEMRNLSVTDEVEICQRNKKLLLYKREPRIPGYFVRSGPDYIRECLKYAESEGSETT